MHKSSPVYLSEDVLLISKVKLQRIYFSRSRLPIGRGVIPMELAVRKVGHSRTS